MRLPSAGIVHHGRAEEGQAISGTTFQHLTGRVWLLPGDADPLAVQAGVALITDERGAVLVDAGQSPAHAREIRAALDATGLPAPRWLVYTHHHWDHVWGACAWPDVEIVGHVAGESLLRAEAARPWSHRYLREQVRAEPRLGPSFRARALAMETFDDFAILPPTRTFTDELELPTGVRLRHVGGRHAPDSTAVLVPDSGVMLLGDCWYPPPAHLRGPDDGPDLALVGRLLDDAYGWYVSSHSPPMTLAEARAALA
ncbi:MBL fold metallo-hydrolase [Micromonospora coxensis]|uniref:Glyoxylase, beta-lactamase superfamily II n=1 Tax=Micromonospora coxensis TaxID=356852 RepID=A0A1C5H983_9ACTN|nr:MBL fold metallo-hydrolase [Micromonospora coxensis]SCG42578.1 Glyoxylase, beta-lactamase superfamily II [Micromonospora coxensis]